MSISQNYKELFRYPTITDTVSLFQSLLVARDIVPEEALALAGTIHAGLRKRQEQNSSVYAQYAQTMALMNHHMPDVYQHVTDHWHLPSTDSSVPERAYDDSLFDDTIAMPAPGSKQPYVSEREPVKDEGGMLEVAGDENEFGEAEGGGEEESEEEDEPERAGEAENEEEEELEIEEESDEESEEDEKSESEDVEEGENEEELEIKENEAEESGEEVEETEYEEVEEPEEIETEEVEYEDVPEAETYKESEVEMDGESMAREAAEADAHMNEVEYEIEPMEDEETPWAAAE